MPVKVIKYCLLFSVLFSSCWLLGCWNEKLELKDTSANIEKAIVSLDSLLAKLPYDDSNYKFRYCEFENGGLRTTLDFDNRSFEEIPLSLNAIQHSSHFIQFTPIEQQKLYFLMKYLADNYITTAVERKDIWYHYYKTSEAVESPHERQVVVYRSGVDTTNFYKQYEVVATAGNLLLLASISHPDL